MFMELSKLIQDYNLEIKGIIHVGAHHLEEREIYNQCNVNNVIWIEGNDDLIPYCREVLDNYNSSDMLLNYLVSDMNDVEINFNITNNTQSSSILEFGKHKTYYPGVNFIKTVKKKTFTLKTIIDSNDIDMSKYNMINLDLQGIELRALKGLGEYIKHIDCIYTEINDDIIYKENDFVDDIDVYLGGVGFERVETFVLDEKWGDALYIRVLNEI
jgi:FkbM family methyltransferase